MEDTNYFRNIWEIYGLKDNPFSTSPLLVKGGTLPIDCFVGRIEQVGRLGRAISSKGGSRIFVYGDVGVGKTSFVNYVRFKALERNYFTPFKEIAIQEDWSPDDFILNTLSAIYATLNIIKDRPIEKKLFSQLETLLGITSSDSDIGISIAGVGGNYAKYKKSGSKITITSLQNFFEEIIKSIIKNMQNEVIIHYNNLELLSEKKVKTIFNNLRDFFQINGIHFIFIGNLSTHSIIQSMPRVSSIFSDSPIQIENLSKEEITKIIGKRFEFLKIKDLTYIVPYTIECLDTLYSLMNGNIRYILNSLSTAISEITQEKPIILTPNDLSIILKMVLDKRYLTNLTNREKEVLFEIVRYKEITNKSLSDKLKIHRPNISNYLKNLEKKGCIYLKRQNGKDKFWSAEHRIRWSLLKQRKDSQQTLFASLIYKK
jgi:DNA-binding MarR family transcriptional regulator